SQPPSCPVGSHVTSPLSRTSNQLHPPHHLTWPRSCSSSPIRSVFNLLSLSYSPPDCSLYSMSDFPALTHGRISRFRLWFCPRLPRIVSALVTTLPLSLVSPFCLNPEDQPYRDMGFLWCNPEDLNQYTFGVVAQLTNNSMFPDQESKPGRGGESAKS
ncbi:Hypothetical protein SMAX5B_002923, partial [Scophthalmus maximus]